MSTFSNLLLLGGSTPVFLWLATASGVLIETSSEGGKLSYLGIGAILARTPWGKKGLSPPFCCGSDANQTHLVLNGCVHVFK